MKIVVFAHVPPPFHGQSYMVELMLRGLGGDCRSRCKVGRAAGTPGTATVQCFHVDARFSDEMEGVGLFRIGKLFRFLKFCREAIWCRLRYGADVFYYIPAPPRRVPFLRDCLVLLFCRPFFRRLIFHWHASGLSEWLENESSFLERSLGRFLLSRPDLSIVLAESRSGDAAYFASRRLAIVPNGIPDPCPEFARNLLPRRRERLAELRAANDRITETLGKGPEYRVLFLAHLTREKGLFDALEAVALANERLAAGRSSPPLRLHLTVAGRFRSEAERSEFNAWMRDHADEVRSVGFVEGTAKTALLLESDCLCFPSYYPAEAQPVAILEAMAFGLNVVASDWRGIPAMLPPQYRFVVPPRDPAALAAALLETVNCDLATLLRERYCAEFTEARHLARLREALFACAARRSA